MALPDLFAHLGPMAAVFVASFLQAVTGFGLVMVAAPLLMFFYDPRQTVLLVVLLAVCGNSAQTVLLHRMARFDIVRRLFVGALLSQPVGYAIYHHFPAAGIKLLVSIVILLSLTATRFFRWRFAQGPKGDFLAGFIAGTMATTTGMGGPALILYFAATDMPPAVLRATIISYFFGSNLLSLSTFWLGGAPLLEAAEEMVRLLPGLIAGILAGQIAFRYLPAARFRQILTAILYVVCVYSIYEVHQNW